MAIKSKKSTGKRGRPAGVKSKPKEASEKTASVIVTKAGNLLFIENEKIMLRVGGAGKTMAIQGVEVPAREIYLSLRRLGKKYAEE